MGHIFKHILRARLKTLLSIAVALLFTLAMGILQVTIINLRENIDRLYNETIVTGEVRLYQDLGRSTRPAGDITSIMHVWGVKDLNTVSQIYLEGSYTAFIISKEGIEQLAPLIQSITDNSIQALLTSYDSEVIHYFLNRTADILVAVNELSHLTEETDGFLGRDDPFIIDIDFAPGHSKASFTFQENTPVPILISQEISRTRSLAPGDYTYIVYYRPGLFRPGEWLYSPALVIGTHDGAGISRTLREGAVIPLPALESFLEDFTGFYTFRFAIDPAFNRELEATSEEIESIFWTLRYPRLERLRVIIWDQELRFGIAPLERHAELLRLIQLMTIAVSAIIGAGFAMLLMLQRAKNAAIMRVLGMPRHKAQVLLWLGHIILCIVGGLAGLLVAAVVGLNDGVLIVALPYLAGAVVGAAAGAVMITNRAPLDLLQVKD